MCLPARYLEVGNIMYVTLDVGFERDGSHVIGGVGFRYTYGMVQSDSAACFCGS